MLGKPTRISVTPKSHNAGFGRQQLCKRGSTADLSLETGVVQSLYVMILARCIIELTNDSMSQAPVYSQRWVLVRFRTFVKARVKCHQLEGTRKMHMSNGSWPMATRRSDLVFVCIHMSIEQ